MCLITVYVCVGVCVQDVLEVWGVAVGICDVLLGGYLDQLQSME